MRRRVVCVLRVRVRVLVVQRALCLLACRVFASEEGEGKSFGCVFEVCSLSLAVTLQDGLVQLGYS